MFHFETVPLQPKKGRGFQEFVFEFPKGAEIVACHIPGNIPHVVVKIPSEKSVLVPFTVKLVPNKQDLQEGFQYLFTVAVASLDPVTKQPGSPMLMHICWKPGRSISV